MPIIYIVRHGDTAYNDDADKRARGWLPIGLNERGIAAAKAAGKFLANKQTSDIFYSDLARTTHTAKWLWFEAPTTKILPLFGLRPWNLGRMNGMRLEEAIPIFDKHIREWTTPLPEGESYGAFYRRWQKTLFRMIKFAKKRNENIVLVTHSRNLYCLDHILTRGKAKIRVDGPPGPGGIVALDIDTLRRKIVHEYKGNENASGNEPVAQHSGESVNRRG